MNRFKSLVSFLLVLSVIFSLVPPLPASAIIYVPGQGAPNETIRWAFINSFNSNVGYPINTVHRWGNGWIQDFRGGGTDAAIMLADGASVARVMWGGIWQKYKALGGSGSFLKYPTSGEIVISTPTGTRIVYQDFQGGRITYHLSGPRAGQSFLTYGGILAKYNAIGGSRNIIGPPITDEIDTPRSITGVAGRQSIFERGVIVYHLNGPRVGQSFVVHMGINDYYKILGGPASWLGFPTSDEYAIPGGARSDFERGYISWSQGGAVAHSYAPTTGAEIIIDEGSPGFSKGGPTKYWHWANTSPRGGALGWNGSMWWTLTNSTWTDNWARWTPSIPQDGDYEVFAFIPRWYGSTANANYQINHAGQTHYRSVRQIDFNDTWVSLGVYRFNNGQGGSVYLADQTGEPYQWGKWIAFDAVKFVYRGGGTPQYVPRDSDLITASSTPKVFYIWGGKKYWVANPFTFEKLGFAWSSIKSIDGGQLNSIFEGNIINLNDGSLLKGTGHQVYVIEQGQKRHIVNPETFNFYGYKWENIALLPDSIVGKIPEGPVKTILETQDPENIEISIPDNSGASLDSIADFLDAYAAATIGQPEIGIPIADLANDLASNLGSRILRILKKPLTWVAKNVGRFLRYGVKYRYVTEDAFRGLERIARVANNAKTPQPFVKGLVFQIKRIKSYGLTNIKGVEVSGAKGNWRFDFVLKNGTIIENKSWANNTLRTYLNNGKLVSRTKDYASEGPVVLEFEGKMDEALLAALRKQIEVYRSTGYIKNSVTIVDGL